MTFMHAKHCNLKHFRQNKANVTALRSSAVLLDSQRYITKLTLKNDLQNPAVATSLHTGTSMSI